MNEQSERMFREDPTVALPPEKYVSEDRPREMESFRLEQRDTVGEAARELRESRKQLTDEAWVKRVLAEMKEGVSVPEGYVFHEKLQRELGSIPPEGLHQRREADPPPLPLTDLGGDMIVPKKLYAGGLVWEVGALLGEGGFGKVLEVRHLGGEQRPRLVKIMMVLEGTSTSGDARGLLWNEVGALMAAGDYVQDETMHDEEGNIWMAVILERHEGQTLLEVIKEGKENPEEQEKHETPKWAYQQAVALRSVVSTLRRMHALGWTHRDIKPGNIVSNVTEGEESLTRPIDFGSATRDGAIRRKKANLLVGSPNYMPPEAFNGEDIDLRVRDYWASVLSTGVAVGMFDLPKISRLPTVYARLSRGGHIESPDLASPRQADAYFESRGIAGAQREFFQWLYMFIQPHLGTQQRQEFWRLAGITQTLDIPSVKPDSVQFFPGEEPFAIDEADFLDDDKFVRELEDHIRALAQQAGVQIPEGMLENLQEFPAQQTSQERILES